MRTRTFGRTGWQVSEIGYGMWGMGGWTGSDDEESLQALDRAIALGCNFFDTAWAYGAGPQRDAARPGAARASAARPLYVATKIPPKNMKWPAQGGVRRRATCIRPITSASTPRRASRILGVRAIDLQQFHVWSDAWADDDGWQRAVDDLKRRGAGARLRHQRQPLGSRPTCCARSRPGSSTACRSSTTSSTRRRRTSCSRTASAHNIAVIARVPFDEGSLTGTLTPDSTLARGRLAQHLLQPGEPRPRRWRASSGSSRWCPTAWTCRSWRCGSSWSTRRSARRSPACAGRRTSSGIWRPSDGSPAAAAPARRR